MIPKTIHCCWFSGEAKPSLVARCLASWRRHAPGFEIREWDVPALRREFDALPGFVEAALKAKKWAFASDWARFAVVERFGGVYFDLDVELVAPIDDLVADGKGFFALETEDPFRVDPGFGFAAPPGDEVIRALAARYESLVFDPACHLDQNCASLSTALLRPWRESGRLAFRLLPPPVFNPKGCANGRLRLTAATRGIHHYGMSWMNWRQRLAYRVLPHLGIDLHPLVMWWRRRSV